MAGVKWRKDRADGLYQSGLRLPAYDRKSKIIVT